MKINSVEIQNFRRLKSIHIGFADQTTLFVGANNSGKTSAMTALRSFLVEPGKFSTRDFTLSNWRHINSLGQQWESDPTAEAPTLEDWVPFLPTMDVWLQVAEPEVHYVVHLLPTLDWAGGLLGIRLRLEPKDIDVLKKEYIDARKAAESTIDAAAEEVEGKKYSLKLWPSRMDEFLERRLGRLFHIKAYTLSPQQFREPANGKVFPQSLPQGTEALDSDPFAGLIRIDEISAQRGFSNDAMTDGNLDEPPHLERGSKHNKRRLSEQLRSYYTRHLDPSESPTPSDVAALQAISDSQSNFDEKLKQGFAGPIGEIEGLGYPGVNDPKLTIKTRIRPTDGLNHPSAVQYSVLPQNEEEIEEALHLPEEYNGLGYQNLISMIFLLMSFRDGWMKVGKAKLKGNLTDAEVFLLPPLHLVLVEEPEAHLHAQVQQVFIRKAYDVLRNHPQLGTSQQFVTQLVVSSHSSHLAHEADFSALRYFRRTPATTKADVPTSSVANLSSVFGEGDETARFVKRYLKTTHCDLFFADAAVIVEGQAERMLVPHFIRSKFDNLGRRYITLLEIGGRHAHRLKPLIEELGIAAVVIADLDSAEDSQERKAVSPARNQGQISSNPVLRKWHPELTKIDELIDLSDTKKVRRYDPFFSVRMAYQLPVIAGIDIELTDEEVIPYTFEDAFVIENLKYFRTLDGVGLFGKFCSLVKSASTISSLHQDILDALKSGNKASFALDILYECDPDELTVPQYIAEALEWLEGQLERRQLEVISNETQFATKDGEVSS